MATMWGDPHPYHYGTMAKTWHDYQKNAWIVRLVCCGKMVEATVAMELLYKCATKGQVTEMLWETFKKFLGPHPPAAEPLKSLGEGSITQEYDSFVFTDNFKWSKPYELKWEPKDPKYGDMWVSEGEVKDFTVGDCKCEICKSDFPPAINWGPISNTSLEFTVKEAEWKKMLALYDDKYSIGPTITTPTTSTIDPVITKLPGKGERVKHPVTKEEQELHEVIMNLNDFHNWTREQIADWLETLDVDLSFKVEHEDSREGKGTQPEIEG